LLTDNIKIKSGNSFVMALPTGMGVKLSSLPLSKVVAGRANAIRTKGFFASTFGSWHGFLRNTFGVDNAATNRQNPFCAVKKMAAAWRMKTVAWIF
jgi:hypothetical protein